MHLLLHVALYDWVSSRRLNLDWSREYLVEWSRDGRKLGNPLTLHLLFSTSINVLEIKLGVASKIMALAKIFFTAAMICAEWTNLFILRDKRRVLLLIMRWFYLPVDIKWLSSDLLIRCGSLEVIIILIMIIIKSLLLCSLHQVRLFLLLLYFWVEYHAVDVHLFIIVVVIPTRA